MMARPRTPIATLKMNGNFRKDRHGDREHEPTSGSPVTCPEWLVGDALDFWNENVPKLQAMNVVDGADQASLIGLSVAWSNWTREQREYETGTGKIHRVNSAWATFDRLAGKFGLNPVDRTKLGVEPAPDENDPFVQWLARRNERKQ